MKNKYNGSNVFLKLRIILIMVTFGFEYGYCQPNEYIVIENDYLKYEVDINGKNISFIDKSTGKNYLDTESSSSFAYVINKGKRHNVTSLSYKGSQLELEFGDLDGKAKILVEKDEDHITFKVIF